MTAVRTPVVPARGTRVNPGRARGPRQTGSGRTTQARGSAQSRGAAQARGTTQARRSAASSRPAQSRRPASQSRPAPPRKRSAVADQARRKVTVHERRFISMRAVIAMSVLTFFMVLLLSVMIQSLRIEGQSRIDRTSRDMAAQNARTLDLRAAIAERESPERIMSKARDLGMIDPGPVAPLSSEASTP